MNAKGALAAVLLLGACASSSEYEKLREDQRLLADRVERLEKRLAEKERGGRADPDKVYKVPVGEAPVLGPENAAVTIVEFADFQCPFCDRVGPTLKRLREQYGNRLRIAFKHSPLPFHPEALPAAVAADCAHRQGKFWEMHDALFAAFREGEGIDVDGMAQELGLDVAKMRACMEGPDAIARVKADLKLGSEVGARGTPAFFVNGRPLVGAQPYESFAALVDEELKKAEKPAERRR